MPPDAECPDVPPPPLSGDPSALEICQTEPLEEGQDIQIQVVDLGQRCRQLQGSVPIPAERERIWQVLTDYDHLAEFIPNLVESRVIGHENGCKLVRQVGAQTILLARFSATVTLAVEEIFPEQIRFHQTEGDFLLFQGFWDLSPSLPGQTLLTYHLKVQPPRRMPVAIVERFVRRNLALNLQAIRRHSLNSCWKDGNSG